jgi:hypothetical protein
MRPGAGCYGCSGWRIAYCAPPRAAEDRDAPPECDRIPARGMSPPKPSRTRRAVSQRRTPQRNRPAGISSQARMIDPREALPVANQTNSQSVPVEIGYGPSLDGTGLREMPLQRARRCDLTRPETCFSSF